MFITEKDLHSKIQAFTLGQIVPPDDTVTIPHALSYAVGVVRSKIDDKKYDIKAIFETEGEARDGVLVSICVDVAIYEIVATVQPGIDLTDRRERRNQAIAYLDDMRDSHSPTGWPLAVADPTTAETSDVEHGGTPPRNNYF